MKAMSIINQIKPILLFFLCLITICVFATNNEQNIQQENKSIDSILLFHKSTHRTAIISQNQKLKIRYKNGKSIEGLFKSHDFSYITLISSGKQHQVPLAEILNIKIKRIKNKKFLGGVLKGTGAVIIMVGAYGLKTGVYYAGQSNEDPGGLLWASPLLMGVGALVYTSGVAQKWTKYRLNRWIIIDI